MANEKGSLKNLLQESLTILTGHYVALLVVAAIGIAFIVGTIVTLGIVTVGGAIFKIDPKAFSLLIGLMAVAIGIVILMLYQVATVKLIQSIDEKKSLTPLQAYQEAYACLWPYAWVGTITLVKVCLWSFLLIVPGIIFGIFYSFAPLALILDGKTGNNALIFSKQIVKPHIGKFLGNSMVVGLIMIIIFLIVSYCLKHIFGDYTRQNTSGISLVGAILEWLCNIFLGIYTSIFTFLLYKEIKSRAVIA